MESKEKESVEPALPARIGDTEKITINLGVVDLGQVDLLVQQGFYSNRSDLIRTAVRNQLALHADAVRQAVARESLVLGLRHLGRDELEALRARGETLHLRVLGLARIADDVPPDLAVDTIASVQVLGAFQAPTGVRRALRGRIR